MRINVSDYLKKTTNLHPEKIAVADSEKKLTFSELNVLARKLATKILEKEIKDCEPIPVFMNKSSDMVAAFLGINLSGNFYVPLDVKSPLSRIETIISVLSPRIIISSKKYDLPQNILNNILVIYIEDINDIKINNEIIDSVLSKRIDTDPIYCIFTSGSTGTPKGVLISHRSVIDYIDWAVETFSITSDEIIGNQAPFYFDNSTLDIYLMYATGATLNIIPEELFIFPVKLIDYLNQHKINFVFWVPFVLVNVANLKALDHNDLPYLKKVLFAGEVMPNKHLNYWRKKMPNLLYANLYGPTEITVDCTYYIVEREFNDDESLPIGISCKNTGIIILNDDNKECNTNEIGELCVRGSSLALGYYNDLSKTQKSFIQNPLQNKYPEIIYKTGDLVKINEIGEIIYLGRKDNQIKHNGYRIELGEIETAALGTKMFENVCVIYDNVRKSIVLFYESKEEISLKEFRSIINNFLPKYMVPNKIVRISSLPRNSNGKIDRLELSKIYSMNK